MISKSSKASDNDENESDECDEKKRVSESCDGNTDEEDEEEDELIKEPENLFGVTPFMSGVIPAGRLRARKRPADCKACGLIKVLIKNVFFFFPLHKILGIISENVDLFCT